MPSRSWLSAALVAALVLGGCGFASSESAEGPVTPLPATPTSAPSATGSTTWPAASPGGAGDGSAGPAPTSRASTPATSRPARTRTGPPSDRRTLSKHRTIGGAISPKSVVASGHGLVFAQNMMYRHSVTVYSSKGRLVRTIPDAVRLARFDVKGHPGVARGAPVEAAFSPDGAYAYVSNYSMYGAGFGPEGSDTCTPASARAAGVSDSYLYRINTSTLKVDQVVRVGKVPKYVAVSPDGDTVLVTNWCSYDMTVIDVPSWRVVGSVPLGAYPRGVVVAPDSTKAYVAVMGSAHVSVVDLRRNRVRGTITVGAAPRHVVLAPDGRHLYATLNGANRVVKVDTRTRKVVGQVRTGAQPRSMDIAPDGRSLYVVNYASNTMAKVRTSDMTVLQTIATGEHPIGVTYDPVTDDVWVAIYVGAITVLRDR